MATVYNRPLLIWFVEIIVLGLNTLLTSLKSSLGLRA